MKDYIEVIGAQNNNLQNVSVKVPKHQITVFTGLSGSGKSSLVFDTIAAESQRLLNETYSAFIQQMLPNFEAPKVESIKNLPVSIVIDQKKIGGNARSTVGTITEIYTGLRLLFSRIAKPFVGYSMVYSFNNPTGMCQTCQGLGVTKQVDIHKLLDFDKSLNEGAIQFPTFQPGGFRWLRYTETGNFDNNKKIRDYSDVELQRLLFDQGSKPDNPTSKWPKTSQYVGVVKRIKTTIMEKGGLHYQQALNDVFNEQVCPDCHGTRVNDLIRSAKINGKSIADCSEMAIDDLIDFLKQVKGNPEIELVLQNILKRLNSLKVVGLDYLTLSRSTTSLSGGESQRIKMTKYLNSALSDVCYIFDEPSVGLHPQDLIGINKIFTKLRDQGNTVLLIDHDPDVIKISDNVIEMGPKAGKKGGQITFEGTYQDLLNSQTITGQALQAHHYLNESKIPFEKFYHLEHVHKYNVTDATINIPQNALTVVTGVAGSGKSTLIRELFTQKYSQAVTFDQSAIKGSNRSNVLTYLGAFDEIRKQFAKISHKSASLFSFNGQGTCSECHGKGYIKYDLAYMGDVKQVCEKCHGKRYNNEALDVTYHGLNIFDVLQLTAQDAVGLFTKKVDQVLNNLLDANLSYLNLGQTLDTLSGGELQRLKIAKSLGQSKQSDLLILDEPSTGLHESDVNQLLKLFEKLLDMGKTLIVLEHNLSIISQAQWIIDLGPRGGRYGGQVLFQGYPVDLMKVETSFTAQHLRNFCL
ncbi:ATP-binding cassette domain-containing protein [Companilactobacillus kedongensis]|uniref:ATP-binding cassette domain-containing protein n=1 Tax=Companilactobacillus kedongensis TaxID=2486004 RepID=UPI000F7A7D4B|nr:excinuclease ABC subunit UvrA [Companilactobacillus kedongensis]